jgi:hypothetical protein
MGVSANSLTQDIIFLENVEPFSARIQIREQADLSIRYPEIRRVLGVRAQAAVMGTERFGDGIMVDGLVRYNVLYEALDDTDAPVLHSAAFEQEFSESIAAAGFDSDTYAFVNARIEEVTATRLDPRSLRLESTLVLTGKGIRTGRAEGLDAALLPPQIERKVCDLQWLKLSQALDQQLALRESVELPARLPAPARLLYSEMQITGAGINTAREAPHIEGDLSLKVVYLCEDASLPPMEWQGTVPFSQPLYGESVSGLDTEILNAQVRQYHVKVREGFEDEESRVLDVEAVIDVAGVMVSPAVNHVVTDLYGVNAEYSVQAQALSGVKFLSLNRMRVPIFEEEWRDVTARSDYYDASFHIAAVDAWTYDGGVRLDGVAVLELLQDTGDGYESAVHEWPFVLDVELDAVKESTACVADLSIAVADGECEAQVELWLYEKEEVPCVCDLEEQEAAAITPGLYIRSVSAGESLWDIGKAYRMPVNVLAEFNGIEPTENPPPGSKLLVYKPRMIS